MANVKLHRESRTGKIALQFTNGHGTQTARYSLPIKVSKEQWSAVRQEVINHPLKTQYNIQLSSALNRARTALLKLQMEKPLNKLTSAELRDLIVPLVVLNEDERRMRFLEIWQECTRVYTERTAEIYALTLRQMQAYDRDLAKRMPEDITLKWLDGFKLWCAKTQCTNTINIRLRCIRHVFNYALNMEYTTAYPFRKLHIKNTDIIKHTQSLDELRKVMTAPIPDVLREGVLTCRLMFVLIGINAKDLYNLTNESIENGRVLYIRAKTHKAYSVLLQPEAYGLLMDIGGTRKLVRLAERYTTHRDFTKRLNSDLRAFCYHLGITPITTNWLRHGWATTANNNGVYCDIVSQALGHAYAYRITAGYIDTDVRNADQANRMVLDIIYKKERLI